MRVGAGQIVPKKEIKRMSDYISTYGEKSFSNAVFNGSFAGLAFAYIHPADKMKTTQNFITIQKAFINAYA